MANKVPASTPVRLRARNTFPYAIEMNYLVLLALAVTIFYSFSLFSKFFDIVNNYLLFQEPLANQSLS